MFCTFPHQYIHPIFFWSILKVQVPPQTVQRTAEDRENSFRHVCDGDKYHHIRNVGNHIDLTAEAVPPNIPPQDYDHHRHQALCRHHQRRHAHC